MTMIAKIFLGTYLITLIALSQTQIPRNYLFPFYDDIPFSYDRYAPISLNTSTARPIPAPPIVNTLYLSQLQVIENVDHGVQIIPISGGQNTLTGGILLNDIYVFAFICFNWDGIPTGRASTETDGQGTPLQGKLFFYNKKYGSFENSLNYSDGQAIVLINFLVHGNIPNPLFIPLENALRRVKVYGSRISRPATFGQIIIDTLIKADYYYAYPGTYIDLSTSRQYPCATIIQIAEVFNPVISLYQFSAFTGLLNSYGQPSLDVLPLHPQGDRPVVQGVGFNVALQF